VSIRVAVKGGFESTKA